MTTRDSLLQEIQSIRTEFQRLLEGIDYCFDWKSDDQEWSAREIVYHVVDTPSGGIHTVLQRVLAGTIQEFAISSSLNNLTPERQAKDLEGVKEDVEAVIAGMENALATASDADLASKTVPMYSTTDRTTSERTAQNLAEGIFVRHWREHLGQLATLREALGLE